MLTSVITAMIRFYQHWLGALKPPCCRFHPTCSEYTRLAVVAHGAGPGCLARPQAYRQVSPVGRATAATPVPGAAAADGSRRSAGGAAGVSEVVRTGLRFFLAMILMLLVFVVTNRLFPPVVPEPPAAGPEAGGGGEGGASMEEGGAGTVAPAPAAEGGLPLPGERDPERLVSVETPHYHIVFSNRGGAVRSIRLPGYESFAREGPVELVPPGAGGVLAGTWQLGSGSDRLELNRLSYDVEPMDGIRMGQGSGPRTLTFRYEHPTQPFASEIRYTFHSDSYVIGVTGRLPARDRAAIFVDLGTGLAINELREADDRRMMAFSGNHVDDGIRSRPLGRVNEPEAMPGAAPVGGSEEQVLPASHPGR